MTDDDVRRDLAGLARGMTSLTLIAELSRVLVSELEKRSYSALGVRTGVSRSAEREQRRK